MAPEPSDGEGEQQGEWTPPTKEEAEAVAVYDLTRKMTPHLDRHMVLPILEFLKDGGIFAAADIHRAQIELLSNTSMVDVVVEKYEALGEQAPEHLSARREEVLNALGQTHQRVLKMLTILEDPDQLEKLRQLKSLSQICEQFELEPSVFDELFAYSRMKFDCGDYQNSEVLLRHWQGIVAQDQEQLPTWRTMACSWGILACSLHTDNEQGLEIFTKIDEYLDTARLGKREILTQRTWFLHWALFGIFRQSGDGGKLLDLFITEKSMMIMAVSSPHLLRYVSAALVLKKRLKHTIKDTVRVIHMEKSSHSDPVTRFLCALYVDVDFDEAQRELKECGKVFQGDFFLCPHWPEFEENARLLIFETYCRIHQCINIAMIATKLNMEAPEAELWIVKLIQNAKLDARIDSEKSRVVMTKAPPSVYQQVIDKTKDLSFRSTMLLSHLEKREQEKAEALATGNTGKF